MLVNETLIEFADDLSELDSFLKKFKLDKYYIVIDSNVYELYKDILANHFKNIKYVVIPSGEQYKNIDTVTYILKELLEANITRGDYLIGIGGGVTLDICGFVASILYRGIKHILIPTTLLADVDATVGGKCGVDFLNRKNIIGTFYEPKGIYITPYFLKTLSKDEFNSGLGELIKYAFLDYNFKLSEETNLKDTIEKAVLIKKQYVEADFKDNGLRMCLNLGHTFGHAIELKYNLLHGLAVLNGIKMIFALEKDLGIDVAKEEIYFNELLDKYHLTLNNYDYHDYLDDIFKDKKNFNGVLNLVFVKDFKPYLYKTTRGELDDKLKG